MAFRHPRHDLLDLDPFPPPATHSSSPGHGNGAAVLTPSVQVNKATKCEQDGSFFVASFKEFRLRGALSAACT